MKKPIKHKIELLDFHECRDYIQGKYKIDIRDYAGRYINYQKTLDEVCKQLNVDIKDLDEDLTKADKNDPEIKRKLINRAKVRELQEKIEPPYQDFWHWIIDACGNVSNGGQITLTEGMAKKGSWQEEILNLFLKEFGEKDENFDNDLTATFSTWW